MSEGLHTAPHLDRAALVTIDVQRDTLDGRALEIPGTTAALEAMAHVAEAFRRAERPIVHVLRLYRADGSNVDPCRRELVEGGARILAPGDEGAELAAGLVPEDAPPLDAERLLAGELQPLGPREWALYKPRWGAFYETALEDHLHALGVDTIVFCGANWPNCPRTSIYEASERDFRLVVAPDAVSGMYDRGLAELEGIGVVLMDSAELARAMPGARAAAG
ncbi:MAG TPA: cysteine hydrolase [Solirubrobacteraceae bacterium]|nr:cysteine hydrolase [Solirubrobacteraceae bacterium]